MSQAGETIDRVRTGTYMHWQATHKGAAISGTNGDPSPKVERWSVVGTPRMRNAHQRRAMAKRNR